MNSLRERIASLIETEGPMSVADYMVHCLFDPEHGYYTTRQPFGADGDFTTAPEISQIFGELIGVWIFGAWRAIGSPLPVTIAEIGPGRGTLMKDVLRTLSRLDADLVEKVSVAMVEASPRLTEVQKAALANSAAKVSWHTSLDALPQTPLIVVANELFDAIPIRQFVRTEAGWRERCVGLTGRNGLHFVAGAGSLDPALLPAGAENAPVGAIFELSRSRSVLMETIACRIAMEGGAGLFFDYGHLESGLGDTLQAVRRHRYEDVLENPGEADITSHVDFAMLAAVARGHGLEAHLTTQGDFLIRCGLLERAGRLGAEADAVVRENISVAVERLAGPDAMGELFKAMAIFPPGAAVPPFSNAR